MERAWISMFAFDKFFKLGVYSVLNLTYLNASVFSYARFQTIRMKYLVIIKPKF